MKSKLIFSILAFSVLGGALAFLYLRDRSSVNSADPTDASLVALGQTVYADQCSECHGKNLEGQPNWRVRDEDGVLPAPPHNETGHTWHHGDELLFNYAKGGGQKIGGASFTSGMPPFEGILSDKEIWAVLAFIKSRWPERIQKRQQTITAQRQ